MAKELPELAFTRAAGMSAMANIRWETEYQHHILERTDGWVGEKKASSSLLNIMLLVDLGL